MNSDDFERFLALLSADAVEASQLYRILHKKLSAFLGMNGVSDPLGAADETIDRAVSKLGAGAIVPDVGKYCFGIARNLVREKRRLMRRETLAFHKFIERNDDSPVEQLERIYGILKPCFEQLLENEQQLLLEYCRELKGRARAEHRRQLAEMMNMTLLALRIKVTRLRGRLTDCAQKRSLNVENVTLVSNKPGIWSILL